MTNVWDARVEKLLGKPFDHKQATAENICHLPQQMQRDKELRAFVWKYALYSATRYPEHRQSLEEELVKLWQVLEERYLSK